VPPAGRKGKQWSITVGNHIKYNYII